MKSIPVLTASMYFMNHERNLVQYSNIFDIHLKAILGY